MIEHSHTIIACVSLHNKPAEKLFMHQNEWKVTCDIATGVLGEVYPYICQNWTFAYVTLRPHTPIEQIQALRLLEIFALLVVTAFRSSYLTKVNKNIKLLSRIGTPGSWWVQSEEHELMCLPWLDLSRTTVWRHGRSNWVYTFASSTSFNLSRLVTALKPEDSLKCYVAIP